MWAGDQWYRVQMAVVSTQTLGAWLDVPFCVPLLNNFIVFIHICSVLVMCWAFDVIITCHSHITPVNEILLLPFSDEET